MTATGEPTSSAFMVPPDVGEVQPCDHWAQDCPEGQKCIPVSLCLPECNPLLQDCARGKGCIPNSNALGRFVCVLVDPTEAQVFEACEYPNSCNPGLYCLEPAVAGECDPQAPGCCTAFCDVTLANTCPGQGQECVPWGAEASVLADVGICRLP